MALYSAAYHYNSDGKYTAMLFYVRQIDNYGLTNKRAAFRADGEGQRSHFPIPQHPPAFGKVNSDERYIQSHIGTPQTG